MITFDETDHNLLQVAIAEVRENCNALYVDDIRIMVCWDNKHQAIKMYRVNS